MTKFRLSTPAASVPRSHAHARGRLSLHTVVFTALFSASSHANTLPASRRRRAGPQSASADPACMADFDSLTAVARRDYAGYQTAIQVRPVELAALTDTVRRAAAAVGPETPACNAVLSRWLSFFQDGHLWLVPNISSPARNPNSSDAAEPASDPARPSLVAVDSATLLFRIPSFDLKYKAAIDSLLSDEAATVARTPSMIIDVRGNGGGGDAAFENLIPLLYTDPIKVVGADAWASPGNAAYFRGFLTLRYLPASDREFVQHLVTEMEQRPNRFVPIDRDTVLRFAAVHAMPRAVAVLFDRGSASTTEEFLLQARQSRKTILFSRARSAGALDYANVREVELASGRWNLRFGTSRSRRLPTAPVDRAGLAPTVPIPRGVTDELTYVRGYLAAHASR